CLPQPGTRRRASKGYRERFEAAQAEVLPVPGRRPVQSHAGRAAEQRLEDDAALRPRQRRPQAEMRPQTEGDVFVVRTADVQPVGVGELFRVAVGRSEQQQHRLARARPVTRMALHERGLLLGVCSNKPVVFTRELVTYLGFASYLTVVLGPEDV